MAYRGKYRAANPAKYVGDSSNIVYRSLWELKLMKFLDNNKNVLRWGSEEVIVPYISPIDGRKHRYFPDFVIEMVNKSGQVETVMIEVKPYKQTREPDPASKNNTPTGRVSRRYLKEVKTWGVNQAKWQAAQAFCDQRGWRFTIMTEKELGIKY